MRARIVLRAKARVTRCLALGTALSLCAPFAAYAAGPAPAAPDTPSAGTPDAPPPATEPSPETAPSSSAAPADESPATTTTTESSPPPAEGEATAPGLPEEAQPAPADDAAQAPTAAPVPASVITTDDGASLDEFPTVTETTEDQAATDQLEGAALEAQEPLPEGVPERLPPLQLAGWWSTFAGVSLATAGGVFAGLAEREQNQAESLATTFNIDAGSRLLYEDVQSDYERHLKRGSAYAWTARGFLIVGGAALISGIVLFAMHKKRSKPSTSARLQWRGGANVEVTF